MNDAASALAPRRLLTLALVLGAFLGMVDATVVAVALDPLSRHFGVSLAASQDVLGVYLVTATAVLPTLGRLGDRFGRRRVYIAGFAAFAIGSVVAALAPTFGLLLLGRAVQATGGGMLTAGSLALIAEHAPRRRTGRSVALMVVAQAVAGLLGPPLGGVLVALWGWQAVFWAGLPVAGAGMVLALRVIPAGTERRSGMGIDAPGAVVLATGLLGAGAGVASLSGSEVLGVPAWGWLGVAALAVPLLLVLEQRTADPLLDGRLLRNPRFVRAAMATLLSTGTLMSCFAFLPYWLENAHGASAALAGLAFLPIGAGVGATSRYGGALGDRGRTRATTTAGMSLAALGLLLAAAAARSQLWPLLPVGLLLLGCGNGLFSSPNTAAAIGVAPRSALGGAAGFLSTARNAGVIIGLGVAGAIYTAATTHGSGADAAAAGIFAGGAVLCLVVAAIARRTYRDGSTVAGAPAVREPEEASVAVASAAGAAATPVETAL